MMSGPHPVYEIEHKGERPAYYRPGIGSGQAAGLLEEADQEVLRAISALMKRRGVPFWQILYGGDDLRGADRRGARARRGLPPMHGRLPESRSGGIVASGGLA
jgi:hypothetical protein